MLRIFRTIDSILTEVQGKAERGSWVNLVSPTEEEIARVKDELHVVEDFLRYPLDEEERSRIELEDGQVLTIVNVPIIRKADETITYDTIPLGLIITESNVITVCLESTELMFDICNNCTRSVHPAKKTRFLLQMLFKTASLYLKYLKQIDRKTNEIERQLHQSMKNEELIKLLELEKSLVYFITSLKSNEVVMEKLLRSQLLNQSVQDQEGAALLRLYPEDKDLLEDVIIENKQAIEMAETYSNILSGMMDAFASVISNNLNIVMKFLTSTTIVMAIPTMIASFGGMNLRLPIPSDSPYSFYYILILSLFLSLSGVVVLARKKMF